MPNFIKILLAILIVSVLGFFIATHFIEKSFEENNKNAFQKWEKQTFLPDDYQGIVKNSDDKFGAYRVEIKTFNKQDKQQQQQQIRMIMSKFDLFKMYY